MEEQKENAGLRSKKVKSKNISVFDKTDWHHIVEPDDYVENAGLPFDLLDNMYHLGVFGMSWCGKGNFICWLF